MPTAGREELLRTFERQYVSVMYAGMTIRIQELREKERTEFDLWLRDSKGNIKRRNIADSRMKLITMCVVDDNGNQILNESDFDVIRNWPAGLSTRIADECMKLSGMTDDDLEEEIKNSPGVNGDGLHSS